MAGLAALFDALKQNASLLKMGWFVILAALVVLNVFFGPEQPHFHIDDWIGFYAAFGFLGGAFLLLCLYKVVLPLIGGKDGDDV